MTDLDPKDDPLDLLAAIDQYRAACAELRVMRDEIAKAARLYGVRQVESLTWAEVAAAAMQVERDQIKAGAVPTHNSLYKQLLRAHAAAFNARERFANLALTHSRVKLLVARRGEPS